MVSLYRPPRRTAGAGGPGRSRVSTRRRPAPPSGERLPIRVGNCRATWTAQVPFQLVSTGDESEELRNGTFVRKAARSQAIFAVLIAAILLATTRTSGWVRILLRVGGLGLALFLAWSVFLTFAMSVLGRALRGRRGGDPR